MRWNSDSSYDNYMVELEYQEITHRIGQIQLVLADRHNWLKVENTHLDPEFVESALLSMPEILTKVVNQNLHLCRTIDRNKAEAEAEEEHLHQQIKASDRIIEELRQELSGYQTLEKLTEDADG